MCIKSGLKTLNQACNVIGEIRNCQLLEYDFVHLFSQYKSYTSIAWTSCTIVTSDTKLKVYKAVVLSSLLYAYKTWTVYQPASCKET